MRSTVCKFKCQSVTQDECGFSAILTPVTSGSKENEDFFKWTPGGRFELRTLKEQSFEPGKDYYIHITSAEVTDSPVGSK